MYSNLPSIDTLVPHHITKSPHTSTQVENEASNYWRTLYKCEKTFADVAAPRAMAAAVKREVEREVSLFNRKRGV